MPGVTIPEDGVALGTAYNTTGAKNNPVHGKQAMRITFSDTSILDDVLKHGADLKISFGKSMRFIYGNQAMEILSIVEPNRHELYQAPSDPSEGELEFAATFTHKLDVKELEEDTQPESTLALQDTIRQIQQKKEASTTAVVDSTSFSSAKAGRRAQYLKRGPAADRAKPQRNTLGQQRSLPTTPLLRGQRSPAENPANITAKLDALRIPLIHLLAMGQDSEQNLASKTRVSEDICLRILREVGNRVGKQWQLVDDVYKDLDLWGFNYTSQADRDQAIANTLAAFNRLRLSVEASEWQMILHPDDRGKPELNPALPQPVKLPQKPTPPPPPSITVTAESVEPPKPHIQVTKKASGEPMARSISQSAAKTGKLTQKDAISRIIGKKGKKTTTAKATTAAKPKGPLGRPPKSATLKANKTNPGKEPTVNSRVKSAERVEDSDEDIEMEDVKISQSKVLEKKATPPPVRQTTAITKVAPTTSPVNSDRDKDSARLKSKKPPSSNLIKSPVKKQRRETQKTNNLTVKRNGNVKATTSQKPKPLPSRDNFARRSSSNSPPKPSPLGSSPPINASDMDNISAASSPSLLTPIAGISTPSQSPLDPIALAATRATKPRYLPRSSPPLKRKAVAPAERDDRISHSRMGTNRLPTAAAAATTHPSSNKRRNTSPPDAHTIQLARKFKEDHARYERLYREVQAITDSFKKKEKLDAVLSMHRDLESLKARISQAASVH